jgi:carbon-monoxide dehydrogenase medium subunit
LKRFEYFAPTSLEEAIALLMEYQEGGRPLAGGTDLLPQMKERGRPVRTIVSLRRLRPLHGHGPLPDGGLRIGAMETAGAVAWDPWVQRHFPGIADGANLIGSIQIRNRATLGGNICNAAPSADGVPALIAYGAQVRIAGPQGERTLPLEAVFRGPGQTVLGPGEILVEIVVPPAPSLSGSAYLRHVPRMEMDIAVVGVGVLLRLDDDRRTIRDARVVLSAVAPTPIRSPRAEAALIGAPADEAAFRAAGEGAAADARPISDVRASADYRRELLKVYTRRAAAIALARARQSLS